MFDKHGHFSVQHHMMYDVTDMWWDPMMYDLTGAWDCMICDVTEERRHCMMYDVTKERGHCEFVQCHCGADTV